MHHNRTLSSCRCGVSCRDVPCVDSFMNGSLMKRNQLKLLLVRRLSVNMQFAITMAVAVTIVSSFTFAIFTPIRPE